MEEVIERQPLLLRMMVLKLNQLNPLPKPIHNLAHLIVNLKKRKPKLWLKEKDKPERPTKIEEQLKPEFNLQAAAHPTKSEKDFIVY